MTVRSSSWAALLVLLAASAAACGARAPAVSPDRESGQSGLMDRTFAGANKCNPKNHDRPFIVEWDATDMSQFEALTVNDVVFVKYEGCDLKIIDSCKSDSVKGALGAYRPIDFTSGSVEKVDIKNEGELYAKLPLASATLGGRVNAGESFLMEYFVAGTRTATRPAEYKAELAKIPGCRGVTHFVYAYNVGAFALGSTKNIQGAADVSTVWGSAGGSSKYASAAEKKGGTLATCRSDSAQEVSGCKVPIRLTLRAIEDGDNPDAVAASAPDTPDAKNLAGKVQKERAAESDAAAHIDAANEKATGGDGRGCLAELDAHDRLQKGGATLSTTPGSKASHVRAACLMKAGQCDAGRELERKILEKWNTPAKAIDISVQSMAVDLCQGKGLRPVEELTRAMNQLRDGAFADKGDAKTCRDAYATIKRLRGNVPLDGELVLLPSTVSEKGPACFAKAGDCAGAFSVFKDEYGKHQKDAAKLRARFESSYPACKGK